MLILPKDYKRKRLRSILSYKFMEASYEFASTNEAYFYVPVDMKYGKVINFKVNSDAATSATFEILTLGIDLDNIEILTTATVLWYEDVERGQIFDTDIEAFSINEKFIRPNDLKHYFHQSNLEGLYLYIKSDEPITKLDTLIVYEDLDQSK